MAINGNIFIVKLNGTQIAGAKSDDIEVRCDLQEIASPSQGDWREYLAGRKDWTVTTNYLVSSADLQKVLNVGTTYAVMFQDRSQLRNLRGSAILVTCKITAANGNICQGSFQFKGTGPLTYFAE